LSQCISCKQNVPFHFQSKGFNQCITCTSIKLGLAERIKPTIFDTEKARSCVLCDQHIPMGLPRSVLCEDCLHVIEENTGYTYFSMYRNSSQPWLVKSGGLVLGPLSSSQVEEKIRNKEIGLFDLVQKPFGRWIYAREEETFIQVVEEVRSRPSAREDTVALTSTGVTEVMEGQEDTLAGARAVHHIDTDAVLPSGNYGLNSSNALRTVMFFIFLVFIGVGVVSLFSVGINSKISDGEYKRIITQANDFYKAGDYNAARIKFEKIIELRELDIASELNLASILVGQGRTAEADKSLDRLAARNLNLEEKARLHVLKGLKNLNDGDVNAAEEFLKQALETDRANEAAVFNMANVYLLKGDQDRALDTLDIIDNPQLDPNLWKLLMAEAAASRLKLRDNPEGIFKIISRVGTPSPNNPFMAEINLLLAYLNAKLENIKEANSVIESILTSEPEVSDVTVENLWMYRKRINWENLVQYCSALNGLLKKSRQASSLWAYCQARAGDPAKAKEISQELYLKKESDKIARSLYAYSELKIGKHDQAEQLLKNQKLDTPFEHWVLAKACQIAKDTACFEDEITKLIETSPSSPFGISEKARLSAEKQDKIELAKWIDEAKEKAWYYQPLRQLELNQRDL